MADAAEDQYLQRVPAFETAAEKASDTVRGIARWVVGGVVGVAGVVISRTSLTSIGSLCWGWRLQLASGAAAIGFLILGYLMSVAFEVLTPRSYGLQKIVAGVDITPSRLLDIKDRVTNFLPKDVTSFADFVQTEIELSNKLNKSGAEVEKASEYNRLARLIRSSLVYEHLLLLFNELKTKLFVLTALLAMSFGIFAWSANPPKAAISTSCTVSPGSVDDAANNSIVYSDIAVRRPPEP